MSGWVTVSGPPRSNWRWNNGTTEPVLPSTLPKRTVTQRMAVFASPPMPAWVPAVRAATSRAWQYISASRLDAPMTLVGFTALSVEISTIASAPVARAASATWRVPAALVSRPSNGFASTIGTCFSAAAWNTSSGRSASNTARMRASSRISAIRVWRRNSGWVSANSRSICHSAYSPLSSSTSNSGPKAATWRASSEPMVPPAPVTITRRPWISRAIPSRSSGTCGRFSRSSIATGLSCSRAGASARPIGGVAVAGCRAVGRGARRTINPCACASSISLPSAGPERSGEAMTSMPGSRCSDFNRSSTAPRSSEEPRIEWPWMRRPVWREPSAKSPATRTLGWRSCAKARRNRSESSPEPTTSA